MRENQANITRLGTIIIDLGHEFHIRKAVFFFF